MPEKRSEAQHLSAAAPIASQNVQDRTCAAR